MTKQENQKPIPDSFIPQSTRFRFEDWFGGKLYTQLTQTPQKMNFNRFYHDKPTHSELRGKMVAWMKSICQKLNYQQKTVHYSVSYMDAIFSKCKIMRKQFKLICFVCIYLAAKLEEKEKNLPYISAILQQFSNKFSPDQFWNCESLIFKILNHNLAYKTPLHYLYVFLEQGIFQQNDLQSLQIAKKKEFTLIAEEIALDIIDLSLDRYEFNGYTSLAMATSAVACVWRLTGCPIVYPQWMIDKTKYNWECLWNCSSLLLRIYE